MRVGGHSLLSHVLDQFCGAGVDRVIVETRETDHELLDVIRAGRWPGLQLDVVHAPERMGTGFSVREILGAAGTEPVLLSTVDTIAPPGAYAQLRKFAEQNSDALDIAVLATTFIHDETPIWVHVGPDTRTVTDFGKLIDPAPLCFGNVRWLSAVAVEACLSQPRHRPTAEAKRDTELMRDILAMLPGRVAQLTIDPIFDVDTPDDALLAEQWLNSHRGG
jgi:NDP-sugar pyrophosphorylase family protein